VSRICADLDTEVAAFRDRSLAGQAFPYVFLDATYCKAWVNHRVVSQAVVVAARVAADGHREVLGFDVGDSEDGAFWTAFLRSLKARGLGGVQLVISDAHAGLKAAIGSVLLGAAWQRCRVHFLRNVLARVPKGSAEMVAATIRTIFAQPGPQPSASNWTSSPACSAASSQGRSHCCMRPPTTSRPLAGFPETQYLLATSCVDYEDLVLLSYQRPSWLNSPRHPVRQANQPPSRSHRPSM
jgi:transposase-like protein